MISDVNRKILSFNSLFLWSYVGLHTKLFSFIKNFAIEVT